MATIIALRASSVSSTYFRKALPAAVSETLPPERSNSLAPTSSSMPRICDEIAGCVRKRGVPRHFEEGFELVEIHKTRRPD
jgi:hypothetical protein